MVNKSKAELMGIIREQKATKVPAKKPDVDAAGVAVKPNKQNALPPLVKPSQQNKLQNLLDEDTQGGSGNYPISGNKTRYNSDDLLDDIIREKSEGEDKRREELKQRLRYGAELNRQESKAGGLEGKTANKGFGGGGSGSWGSGTLRTGTYLDEFKLSDSELQDLKNEINKNNNIVLLDTNLEDWTNYEGTKKNIKDNYNYYMMQTAITQPLYTAAETSLNAAKTVATRALRLYITNNLPKVIATAVTFYLAKEAVAVWGFTLATVEGGIALAINMAHEIGAEALADIAIDINNIISEGKNIIVLFGDVNQAGDVFDLIDEKHNDNLKWKEYYKDILDNFNNWYKSKYGSSDSYQTRAR